MKREKLDASWSAFSGNLLLNVQVCTSWRLTISYGMSHTYTDMCIYSNDLVVKQTFHKCRDSCVYKNKMSHDICLNIDHSGSTVEPAPQFQEVLPITVCERTVSREIIGVNHVASFLSCCKCNEKVDPSPEHAFIECAKCHFKQKQTAFKAHWVVQVLFQDTNDDRIDLTLFEDAIH